MRKLQLIALCGLALLGATSATAEIEATEAFDQLKSLAGTWTGTAEGEGEEAEAEAESVGEIVHRFELSAAGTVVMETMGPGSPYEMINMYHLDGDDLVLTHYCAGGNQPTMRLDRTASRAGELHFEFTGGTNFDPAVDEHIHSAVVALTEDGRLDSRPPGRRAGGQDELPPLAGRLSRRGRRARPRPEGRRARPGAITGDVLHAEEGCP